MPRPNDPDLLDTLTGLSNERHFEIAYDFAFAVAERGIPLSVVMLELHDFEGFRDGHSEYEAEGVLRRFGEILGGTTRRMDVVARIGDSRCACLLLDCNLQGGMVFADRVQAMCEPMDEEWGLFPSAGLAAYASSMKGDPNALRLGAEEALREALDQGAGTVVAHKPE